MTITEHPNALKMTPNLATLSKPCTIALLVNMTSSMEDTATLKVGEVLQCVERRTSLGQFIKDGLPD